MTGVGLIWDSTNYSCAYDSILTSLNVMYSSNDNLQQLMQSVHIPTMKALCEGIQSAQSVPGQLVQLRDQFRDWISGIDPNIFPRFGQVGTAYDEVLNIILKQNTAVYSKQKTCNFCGHQSNHVASDTAAFYADYQTPSSIADWVAYIHSHITTASCPVCMRNNVRSTVNFHEAPPLIVFHLNIRTDIQLSLQFNISVNGQHSGYTLKSIIYFGSQHFTSRNIEGDDIWYHDGISTSSNLLRESISNTQDLLFARDNRRAVGLIYTRSI